MFHGGDMDTFLVSVYTRGRPPGDWNVCAVVVDVTRVSKVVPDYMCTLNHCSTPAPKFQTITPNQELSQPPLPPAPCLDS